MTQEDKQLLLADLCSRLPYGVKVNRPLYGAITRTYDMVKLIDKDDNKWLPYLRSLSRMTEEEKSELKEYLDAEEVDCNGFGYTEGGTLEDYVSRIPYSLCNYVIDWLNAHHFDYRTDDEGKTMIEKGLALEAPEGT